MNNCLFYTAYIFFNINYAIVQIVDQSLHKHETVQFVVIQIKQG